MRTSVIVALLMVGLVAVGIRMQRRHWAVCAESVAYADQPAPPAEVEKAPAKAEKKDKSHAPGLLSRVPQTPAPPIWKTEVTGDFETTPEVARKDALLKAAGQVAGYMQDRFPGFRYQPTPKFLTDHRMVDEAAPESEIIDSLPDKPTMHKQKVTVELRDYHLAQLLQEDRRERSVDRLWQGGRVLGGIVVALLALIGYVRLDDWTKGYFSLALKFTALTLAVAGVILLWWLV